MAENPASTSPSDPPPAPIQILGGVDRPGWIPFRKGADLGFYLREAGVPPADSGNAKVQIIRGEAGKKQAEEFEIGSKAAPAIRGGDIVIVHPAKASSEHFLEKPIAVVASAAAFVGAFALCVLMI